LKTPRIRLARVIGFAVILAVSSIVFYRAHTQDWITDKDLIDNGKEAPDVVLPDLGGTYLRLSKYRGYVVWLSFFDVSHEYAINQLKWNQTFYDQWKDQNFIVWVVVEGNEVEETRHLLKRFQAPFVVVIDKEKKAQRAYRAWKIPTSYLIDREGYVRFAKKGKVSLATKGFQNIVETWLKSGSLEHSIRRQ